VAITVRDARAGDEDTVVELVQELARATGGSSPVDREHVRRWLADPACGAVLGELDGRVAGLLTYQIGASLYHAGRCSVIEELVVCEEARGRGVGGALWTRPCAAHRRRAAPKPASPRYRTTRPRLVFTDGTALPTRRCCSSVTSNADVPERQAGTTEMSNGGNAARRRRHASARLASATRQPSSARRRDGRRLSSAHRRRREVRAALPGPARGDILIAFAGEQAVGLLALSTRLDLYHAARSARSRTSSSPPRRAGPVSASSW